ncbi:MAG: TetR/AcrR family transcriptional regulator [Acidobacteriaceae bacterium]|nr:TetR/AcrR family transcriptional regulator [Acidobacteriaceae bacterium]MBV8569172.1 TetR/AcrR family transcriptional regulator [Acidobacteriaceae bacterium]
MPSLVQERVEDSAPRGRGRPRDELVRTRILAAALATLEELGFANATCDAIAERAGASKATIYRWWPNKAAVLIEAVREAVAQELPFPDTGDVREDLRLQLRNFVRLLNGRRGRAFKAFVAAAQSDPEVSDAFRSAWVRPRRQYAKAGLERYRGKSFRDDVDLDLVMDCLYGPLYYRLLLGHGSLSEKYTDALTDLVIASIGKGSGQAG